MPDISYFITNYRYAQILSSLGAWCHWISIWAHSDGLKEPVKSLVSALVTSSLDVFSPSWSTRRHSIGSTNENEKIYQAGLQLLSSIVSVIRTSNLWSCPSWNDIFNSVHDISYLPPTVSFICTFHSTFRLLV